jgi:hypothetical protein
MHYENIKRGLARFSSLVEEGKFAEADRIARSLFKEGMTAHDFEYNTSKKERAAMRRWIKKGKPQSSLEGSALVDAYYPSPPSTYRWVITKDYISEGEDKGVQGPRDADPNLKTNRSHFVMKDDDGEVYYEGDIYGEYDGFEPLNDFGMPNAGATSIWYKGEML